jgi:uncharacterized Zn-finger protein
VATWCRNRRATVCPACSALYKVNAYHLFVAGLRGGKNVPDIVVDHPRLFVRLTATTRTMPTRSVNIVQYCHASVDDL